MSTCNASSLTWHSLVNTTEEACPVLVLTSGGTCESYCESQGRQCIRGQDNVGSECTLDPNHERQITDGNGCRQTWTHQ
eukprot:3219737-Prymnesium_polylepis.2